MATHRRHAEAFGPLVGAARSAADLGTGGGLPGLVLAVQYPAVSWAFVEARAVRADFLQRCVERLDLEDRVVVLDRRAELVGRDTDHRGQFDLVTARSFGAPAVVAECAAPLLRPGGRLVVSEPPDVPVSDRWPAADIALLGFTAVTAVAGPPHLAMLDFAGPCPEEAPRKVGAISKRPRF